MRMISSSPKSIAQITECQSLPVRHRQQALQAAMHNRFLRISRCRRHRNTPGVHPALPRSPSRQLNVLRCLGDDSLLLRTSSCRRHRNKPGVHPAMPRRLQLHPKNMLALRHRFLSVARCLKNIGAKLATTKSLQLPKDYSTHPVCRSKTQLHPALSQSQIRRLWVFSCTRRARQQC